VALLEAWLIFESERGTPTLIDRDGPVHEHTNAPALQGTREASALRRAQEDYSTTVLQTRASPTCRMISSTHAMQPSYLHNDVTGLSSASDLSMLTQHSYQQFTVHLDTRDTSAARADRDASALQQRSNTADHSMATMQRSRYDHLQPSTPATLVPKPSPTSAPKDTVSASADREAAERHGPWGVMMSKDDHGTLLGLALAKENVLACQRVRQVKFLQDRCEVDLSITQRRESDEDLPFNAESTVTIKEIASRPPHRRPSASTTLAQTEPLLSVPQGTYNAMEWRDYSEVSLLDSQRLQIDQIQPHSQAPQCLHDWSLETVSSIARIPATVSPTLITVTLDLSSATTATSPGQEERSATVPARSMPMSMQFPTVLALWPTNLVAFRSMAYLDPHSDPTALTSRKDPTTPVFAVLKDWTGLVLACQVPLSPQHLTLSASLSTKLPAS
jgi:hypothetical protein